ncbi:MAG: YeeE/YedE thiosulfate transporter family protein [Rhodospirillaceae bacterium]
MEGFTPFSAALGGLLIGAGAVLLLLGNGRVMGVGGIVDALLKGDGTRWRIGFMVGMLVPGVVAAIVLGMPFGQPGLSVPLLIVAGLLVGFGSRMGNGCTSGHGICGLARFSKRSLVATMVFFTATAATVFVMRHVLAGGAL